MPWTTAKTRPLLLLFCIGILVAACARLTGQSPEVSRLTAQFVSDGKPVEGSLTVSDGITRQSWTDVESLSAEVPSTATYIIEYTPEGDTSGLPVTVRDIIPVLTLDAGKETKLIINLVDPAKTEVFDPRVLVSEAGANTTVRNVVVRDGPRRTVSTQTTPASGGIGILSASYATRDDDRDRARDSFCGENCPHVYSGISCDPYCYACSTACIVKNGYWQAEYNICNAFTTETQRSDWDELPPETGGVFLAATLRNDGIVYPLWTRITGAKATEELRPPFSARSFPDYVVPVGAYVFEAAFDGLGWRRSSERVALPVDVTDGKNGGLLVMLPRRAETLSEPYHLADNRLGAVPRRVDAVTTDTGMEVSVTTSDPDPGNGWYAIPTGGRETVRVTRAGAPLVEGRDFTRMTLNGRDVIVVRTEGASDRFAVTWG